MKPAAYLVELPANTLPRQAAFLDCARAVDYAAQHHGSVAALVRASEAEKTRAQLEAIRTLVNEGQGHTDQLAARIRAILES